MEIINKALGLFLAALLVGGVIAILIATPLWLLWNWLMPAIFGLKTITWLQALGLAFLSSILFKNTSSSSSK